MSLHCISKKKMTLFNILSYHNKNAAGWGRTSGGGPAANILQQAKLPLVSHNDCKQKYGIVDRSAHLCAGEGHAAASGGCNGDSGGPLACEIGGRWYLHGAVSFGKRDCPTTHYTVFTRITNYRSWILEKIGEFISRLRLSLSNIVVTESLTAELHLTFPYFPPPPISLPYLFFLITRNGAPLTSTYLAFFWLLAVGVGLNPSKVHESRRSVAIMLGE